MKLVVNFFLCNYITSNCIVNSKKYFKKFKKIIFELFLITNPFRSNSFMIRLGRFKKKNTQIHPIFFVWIGWRIYTDAIQGVNTLLKLTFTFWTTPPFWACFIDWSTCALVGFTYWLSQSCHPDSLQTYLIFIIKHHWRHNLRLWTELEMAE